MEAGVVDLPSAMKAIRLHRLEMYTKLVVEKELKLPDYGENQVLIRVYAAGINPIDVFREGRVKKDSHWPIILGNDGAGVVVARGTLASKFDRGQKVFFCKINATNDGTYAEYVAVDEDKVFRLNQNFTFEMGAAIGIPYFTAYRALVLKCKCQPGESIVVHGAMGGAGMAVLQVAQNLELRVLGTADSLEGRMLVQGGERSLFQNNYMDDIMDDTGGKGVDIIIEMLPELNLSADMCMIAPNGRIAIMGFRGQELKISPRDLYRESSVVGVCLESSTPDDWEIITRTIQEMLDDGNLVPIIEKVFPLQETFKAHHELINSLIARGKLVLAV